MVKKVLQLVMVTLVVILIQPVLFFTVAYGASDLEIVVSKDKMLDYEVHANFWTAYPHGFDDFEKTNIVGYQKFSNTEEYVSYAAIQFNLDTVDSTKIIQSADLKIYIKDRFALPDAPFLNVWGIDNDNWFEDSNVAPHPNDLIPGQLLHPEYSSLFTGQWVTFDVTSFIRTQTAGNKLASFVLGGRTTNPIGGGNTESAVTIPDRDWTTSDWPTKHCRLAINYAPVGATITADQALTEANLNGRQITVNLSGTTFVATLTADNLILSNMPPGVAVASVSRDNDTTATLNLSFDGTDFDANRNLGLTIAASELVSGEILTAGNTLPITATNDPESITLTQATDIWEGEEDGKVIIVTLSGGTFSPVLNPANWTVSNLPAGVSKGAVTRVNVTTVHIALSGNATAAYAGDITNVSVTLTTAEYDDSTGGGSLTASSGILLEAKTMPTVVTGTAGSITATTAAVGGEVTGDGHVVVTARGIEYRVSGVGDYTAVAASTAGTGTFSVGLTGLTPNTAYQARAYATNAKGTAYGEVITFTTAPISATISADPALTEVSLSGRQITVTLSGTTFAATLTAGNFSLNDAPPGVGIASVSRVNDTTATLNLSYDGTDFDTDRNLGLTIAALALASGESLTAGNTLTVTATDDPELITLSQATDIWEGEEDGKVITVTLSGGTFSPVLNPANWTVGNLPAGVSKGEVTRVNATTVQINLSGNATAAYAGDITNVSVTLTTDEYDDSTGGGSLTVSSGILFKAKTTPTVVTGTAGSITATTATVGGEVTGDGHAAVTARGIEYRVSGAGDYTAVAAGTGTGVFSAALTGLTPDTTYQARAYATNVIGTAHGEVITFTTAPISAPITADQALTEANLNGRQITVTLSGTTFAATLTAGNFTLNDAPPGVGIASVSRVNDTTATLNISYDGTDFDSNRNMGLTMAASELASGASLTAGNTLTVTATDDPESITLSQAMDIWEGEEDGKVITVTLSCGTFSPVLTPANWTVSNLPAGVNKGAVTRVNATTVQITLSGNATAAYAGDITNVSVTLPTDEYDDSTGGGSLTVSSGILFKAKTTPTVVTGTAGSITATTATVGGEVTGDGHAAITARGIEYRVSGIGDYTAIAVNTTGTGTFSVGVTGLTPNTAYQARAYATNAKGTAYGEVITFTTRPSSSSGSSGSGSLPPTPPTRLVIGDTAIAKETITTPDGKTVETFTVQAGAQPLIEAGKNGAGTVEFKVASTPSSTTVVNVPSTVLQSAIGLSVAVSTPNATLELPPALVAALAAAGQDLSITVERGDAVVVSAQMSGVSGTDGAEVLGTPAVVETGARGPVTVTLPLTGITIPTAPAERQALLDSLRVFAIHSDGEKKIITGTIVYGADGNPVGISFSVDKFSTFAVIRVAIPAIQPGPAKVVKLTMGEVRATVGGEPYTLDAVPYVKPGVQRTLVPVRFVSEALGAKVDWHEETRQVLITNGGTRIVLTIGVNEVTVNGTPTALDCPAEIVMPSGRTFIPLRFVSETLGARVDWDATTQEITITR